MEITTYATLSRQSGLLREMQVIANNIANSDTTGFRQEGVIFSEYVQNVAQGDVAMNAARVRNTSFAQGTLEMTGSAFDLAIEGNGFFMVDTPNGQRLTRAGAFAVGADGTMVNPDGHPVLDPGGAPIFIPPDASGFAIGRDGTISAAGRPIGQIGVVQPLDPMQLKREGGVLFSAEAGVEPVENPRVMQGFVEASNVNPILQVTRMVEVQRAYELGQSFLDREDERVRTALKAFTA